MPVPFDGPEQLWHSRTSAYRYLKLRKAEFAALVAAGTFPRGRSRRGRKNRFWTREDLAWMLWYLTNQDRFRARERPAKAPPAKSGQ